MMRTTIRLDDALVVQAKQLAAQTGRSLSDVVEDALRQALATRQAPRASRDVELPRFGGRLQPGVDLDDTSALLELMERANPAH